MPSITRLFRMFFLGHALHVRKTARPPTINLGPISINGAVLAVLVAINGQTFDGFPTLGGADIPF